MGDCCLPHPFNTQLLKHSSAIHANKTTKNNTAELLLAFKAAVAPPGGINGTTGNGTTTADAAPLDSWQPGSNPCGAARPWDGVLCDAGGRAAGLRLERRGLRGQLPASLAGVEMLAELYLSGNALSGTLPPEWSQQPRLTVVDVSLNRLEGTLPEAWGGGALPALQRFDAAGNGRLGGTLPASWAGMASLQVL